MLEVLVFQSMNFNRKPLAIGKWSKYAVHSRHWIKVWLSIECRLGKGNEEQDNQKFKLEQVCQN